MPFCVNQGSMELAGCSFGVPQCPLFVWYVSQNGQGCICKEHRTQPLGCLPLNMGCVQLHVGHQPVSVACMHVSVVPFGYMAWSMVSLQCKIDWITVQFNDRSKDNIIICCCHACVCKGAQVCPYIFVSTAITINKTLQVTIFNEYIKKPTQTLLLTFKRITYC